jgi:hypothetical protein
MRAASASSSLAASRSARACASTACPAASSDVVCWLEPADVAAADSNAFVSSSRRRSKFTSSSCFSFMYRARSATRREAAAG